MAASCLILLGQHVVQDGEVYFFKALAAFTEAWLLIGQDGGRKQHPLCPERVHFASLCSLSTSAEHAAKFHR